jgi:AraC family transcriptional regulator
MIFHQFPDLEWLRAQAERRFSNRQGWQGRVLKSEGWPSVILNVEADRVYRNNIRGPLSIFTNLGGESHVEVERRTTIIKEGFFFVTNPDQHYALAIENQKTTTFNIHFGEQYAEEVLASLSIGHDHLFEPFTPCKRLNFYNRLHKRTEKFESVIRAIKDSASDPLLLEENLYALMLILLDEHTAIAKSSQRLSSVRQGTKDEVVKRLLIAVDFIYSSFDKNVSLEDMASAACLSKFHFLRLFNQIFKKTPHQFVADIRIERAKTLLRKTSLDVASIGKSVGYKDSSSFSRAFYNETRVYPSQYRTT